MIILIPAYEPDLRLPQLVRSLREAAPAASVVVVDDGSGPAYRGVFDVTAGVGAEVLRLDENHGKGAALKRGFAWAVQHRPGEAVVCADSDGQHAVPDIVAVAEQVAPGSMVLGGREFTGTVPVRSRVGNTVSRWVFRAVTGTAIRDTQTGLRGYPADLLGWLLSVEGERFEYESNLLFEAKRAGVRVVEIPIQTIYLDANASSHFRPVRDSARIYGRLLGFVASSLAGAGVDWVGVLLLSALTGNLLVSVVGARVLSAAVNFSLNRTAVFADHGPLQLALRRYAVLACGILAGNYLLLVALTHVGLPLVVAKLITEVVLFIASYVVQHRVVFAGRRSVGVPVGDPSGVSEDKAGAAIMGPWHRSMTR